MKRWMQAAALVAAGAAMHAAPASADVQIDETTINSMGSRVERQTFVKGEARRVVSDVKVSGALKDAGAKTGTTIEIYRLDQDAVWAIDPKAKQTREIKLADLKQSLANAGNAPSNPNAQPLRSLYSTGTPEMKVTPSGATKTLHGLAAEEYVGTLVLPVTNVSTGSRANVYFNYRAWVTKDARLLGELGAFEKAYQAKVGARVSVGQVQALSGQFADAFTQHLRAMMDATSLGGFVLASNLEGTWEALPESDKQRAKRTKMLTVDTQVKAVRFDPIPSSSFELPGPGGTK